MVPSHDTDVAASPPHGVRASDKLFAVFHDHFTGRPLFWRATDRLVGAPLPKSPPMATGLTRILSLMSKAAAM
jgi:hypothetical protein